jgi:ABC-type branched-subunit amino acid transport system ATPase component
MTVLLVEQNFRFASKVADRFYLMIMGVWPASFRFRNFPGAWICCMMCSGCRP